MVGDGLQVHAGGCRQHAGGGVTKTVAAEDLQRGGEEALAHFGRTAGPGGALWNVNSTAVGGGVAELLQPLIGYSRGLGVDARWLVIPGSSEFFKLTKRLHHALHGAAGGGEALGDPQRALYEDSLRASTQ